MLGHKVREAVDIGHSRQGRCRLGRSDVLSKSAILRLVFLRDVVLIQPLTVFRLEISALDNLSGPRIKWKALA